MRNHYTIYEIMSRNDEEETGAMTMMIDGEAKGLVQTAVMSGVGETGRRTGEGIRQTTLATRRSHIHRDHARC